MNYFTQKDKQKRGTDFEGEFRKSCNAYPCYVYKMLNMGYGTPFDYSMMVKGGAHALELKRIVKSRLAYSGITDNERNGLSQFELKVPTNKSWVLVNIKNEITNVCYLIPWREIKNEVCSGSRGSIQVRDYIKIPKILNLGWDLSHLVEYWRAKS